MTGGEFLLAAFSLPDALNQTVVICIVIRARVTPALGFVIQAFHSEHPEQFLSGILGQSLHSFAQFCEENIPAAQLHLSDLVFSAIQYMLIGLLSKHIA